MARKHHTRRAALAMLGALATVSGTAVTGTVQDDEGEGDGEGADGEGDGGEGDDGADDDHDHEMDDRDRLPIVLGGRTEYWYGVAPEAIEGEENPTLELAAGEEYELVWINLDGVEHELVVEDGDGEALETSDDTESAGEAVSMTFEATDDMTEYYCEYHPESMRGGVELGDGFDLSPSGGHEDESVGDAGEGDAANETDDGAGMDDGAGTDDDGNETDESNNDGEADY